LLSSVFVVLASFENILVIILVVFCLLFSSLKKKNLNIFAFTMLYVIISFTLTGLITPVMGAMVRYKVPSLPFFIIGMLILFDKDKFKRTTEKIKNTINYKKR